MYITPKATDIIKNTCWVKCEILSQFLSVSLGWGF